MENSEIAWTDNTFNPWIGCTKVSDGCKNCYAETLMDKRLGKAQWGPRGIRVKTSDEYWKQPLKWNRNAEREGKRVKVFCASLADVFEDNQQLTDWRRDLFSLIERCRSLDWLLLTKRPENVNRLVGVSTGRLASAWFSDCDHVWIGTTIEDQKAADERLLHLQQISASILFTSCEPLLGPINFRGLLPFDWCIVGGESGANARPMKAQWALDIKDQCCAAGVSFFMKQLSQAQLPRTFRDFDSFIDDLKIREFPRVTS